MTEFHCDAGLDLVAALADELAANARRRNITLDWSAAELEFTSQLLELKDRESVLQKLWAASSSDAKVAVKLSNELRQTQKDIQQVLGKIPVDAPAVRSQTSQRASMAANKRWDRVRDQEAAQAAQAEETAESAAGSPRQWTLRPVPEVS